MIKLTVLKMHRILFLSPNKTYLCSYMLTAESGELECCNVQNGACPRKGGNDLPLLE
jgi:hypothetical protein